MADNKSTASEQTLKQGMQARLPEYMVPSVFMMIDAWPLTANGKINRRALPAPDAILLQREMVAPDTDTERALTAIWAKLLGLETPNISATANFFELGGHSLLAVQLVTHISAELAVTVALKDLFVYGQLRQLAEYIEGLLLTQGSETAAVASYGVSSLLGKSPDKPALPSIFLVPGMGCTALTYRAFATHLADQFEVMVLTTPGIDELVDADSDLLTLNIDQRVDYWYKAIKVCQPQGPYRLVGHSFGCQEVFELARRLENGIAGAEVEVVMVDSGLTAFETKVPAGGLAKQLLPSEVYNELSVDDAPIDAQILYQKSVELGLAPPGVDLTQFEVYCQAFEVQMALFYGYQPAGKLAGKVTLVLAAQGLAVAAKKQAVIDYLEQWCTQTVEVMTSEGDHKSIMLQPALPQQLMGVFKE